MSRETFEKELKQLTDDVLLLGSMVEEAVRQAVTALRQHDKKSARRIRVEDMKINAKRYEIEQNCLVLIATQQPMARDLRFLAAVFEIITELERMGDYAKGIANITIRLSEKEHIDLPKGDIKEMAELGLGMLHRALEAFTQLDVETARIIPAEDDRVDELYNRIYHKLVKRVIADPENVDSASHIMWAAHDLERLADRVTNICERIVFVVTGEMTEMDHNDDEVKGK